MAERRRRWRAGAFASLAVGLVLLAGCSGGGEGTGGPITSSASAGTASQSPSPSGTATLKVARIGVISSADGPLGATGTGVRNSVEVAVLQANALRTVPGWRFEVVARNDEGAQAGGQQAASELSETDGMVGVVASMSSTIDEGVQPILNNRGIPMVSPGGTAAQLTRRLAGSTVVRPFPTYFRLSPTDADQGRAGARFAARELKVRRVAVVSDGGSYGRLLAATFTGEARRLGIKRPVVRTLAVAPGTSDAVAAARTERLARDIEKADVDAVFLGGSAAVAVELASALDEAGVRAPLMGGDALFGRDFVDDLPVSAAIRGDYAVFPGAAATELATASDFVTAYQAAGFGDDPGPFGANAFDAAQAVIRSFAQAVDDADEVTPEVLAATVAALDAVRFEGVTGPVAFDAFGDAADPPLSVYRLRAGVWTPDGVVRLRAGQGVGARS